MSNVSTPQNEDEFLVLKKQSTPPGWWVHVYAAISETGVAITRLDIRTDLTADATSGITATTLGSIKLPELRREVVELLQRLARQSEIALAEVDTDSPVFRLVEQFKQQTARRAEMASRTIQRRTSLKKQTVWANQAEQALNATAQARQERKALNVLLETIWNLYPEGVKSRIRNLKKRTYIRGRGRNIVAGDALTLWRINQATSKPEEN
jgi:hypothetical protein